MPREAREKSKTGIYHIVSVIEPIQTLPSADKEDGLRKIIKETGVD